jgi:hypothetical protein
MTNGLAAYRAASATRKPMVTSATHSGMPLVQEAESVAACHALDFACLPGLRCAAARNAFWYSADKAPLHSCRAGVRSRQQRLLAPPRQVDLAILFVGPWPAPAPSPFGRRRRATCEDSDSPRVAEYFIVPRRKGGFVMFSVQSNLKTAQERDVTNEENLAGFRKACAGGRIA